MTWVKRELNGEHVCPLPEWDLGVRSGDVWACNARYGCGAFWRVEVIPRPPYLSAFRYVRDEDQRT